ncbi:MAG: hypothetical protein ABI723_07950 [Bacteroidia bacterium]
MFPEEQAKYDAWHDESENWTSYGIYHNPGDKRLFPPTRHFNYGLTINFANPLSVIAQAGLIIIFILAPILIC